MRSTFILTAIFFVSCGSYNQKIQRYYSQMEAGKYNAAYRTLDNISYLQKPRNKFLYYAEKGRMAHLVGLYDSSNNLLNEADNIAEVRFKSVGDKVTGTLLNPMMQTYYGEPFERFMLHYYKALNYSYMGDMENALVEARRISLATNEQMDAKKEKDNKYSRDAFSLNLQGIIYEMAGDMNNAFIAYRNAVETYLSQKDNTWYGVAMPAQLKNDLLRTAYLNGFMGEVQRFENIFNTTWKAPAQPGGGELVLFLENGKAPVKQEENLMFALVKGAGGFYFTDPTGGFVIPMDVNRYNTNNTNISDLRTFRVALPKYFITSPSVAPLAVSLNGQQFQPEIVEDINTIALETMRENRLKDITNALTRLLVKKIAEAGAREAGKAMAKDKKNDDSEEEKKRKEKNAEAVGDAVGLIFQAFSFISEKADTRNWQSLPAYIQYVRIPLSKGANKITVQLPGSKQEKTIEVQGRGGLQVMNLN